ncbi:LAME_0E06942g1_1 [Lachancea meyersii CBS 8951]|uniref:LAME_0E06942g1_1 n=1 Tax=Lachancea meyersii CBS 8951 TaxID=1266667 RepID=A0A1G4JIA2_9SACH|nr:LAME_0E06942g1_1 [Lachancea meyersii CBS 8951]
MSNSELLDDLNDDFGSDVESEVEVDNVCDSFGGLERFLMEYKPILLDEINPENIGNVSQIFEHRELFENLMQETADSSSALLLSKTQPLVQQDIDSLHAFLRGVYEETFPELQSIVTSAETYARVIKILEHSQGVPDTEQLQEVVSREQMLVLSMAIQTGYKNPRSQSSDQSFALARSIEVLLELCNLQQRIKNFVASLISQTAPNLCALVGSETAAALIDTAGGIQTLSETPSCNIASMGKSRFVGHKSAVDQSGVRQKGFVFHCPLVSEQPVAVRKQALKMTCAKVSLCARVDTSKSSQDGSLGSEWRKDILHKLQNIQEPPKLSNVKALPIPEDKPKKKRAGRRFRKYKEQFQLSHARQLQNRMEFGKQESSVVDIFGEEVGMGMASTLRAPNSAPTKRTAKLRATMQRRLAAVNQDTHNFFATGYDQSNVLKAPSDESTNNTKTQDKNTKRRQTQASGT